VSCRRSVVAFLVKQNRSAILHEKRGFVIFPNMSLALVQGYTSEEDESRLPADSYSSEEEEEVEAIPVQSPKPWLPPDVSAARTSLLPSATHIFSEVWYKFSSPNSLELVQ
jgi:hypothetical protein